MVELRFAIAMLFVSSLAWAGNGSSGVGTAGIPVAESIYGSDLGGRLMRKGDRIVEINSGRVVFEIVPASQSEVAALENSGRLVTATLGSVSNQYEYTPEIAGRDQVRGAGEKNYWILCGRSCFRLVPAQGADHLAAKFIGTLVQR